MGWRAGLVVPGSSGTAGGWQTEKGARSWRAEEESQCNH